MSKRPRLGFTLLELVLALAITGIILATIMYLSTSAVRYQTEAVFRDRVTSGALYSLDQMRRELQNATFIQGSPGGCSTFSTTGCDEVAGCQNWSTVLTVGGGAYTSGQVSSFYFCLAGTQLYRYTDTTQCLIHFSPVCGGGLDNQQIVVNDPPGLYHTSLAPAMFVKKGDSSIEIHYMVGYPGQKANRPVPIDYLFNIRVNTNKAYADTND